MRGTLEGLDLNMMGTEMQMLTLMKVETTELRVKELRSRRKENERRIQLKELRG